MMVNVMMQAVGLVAYSQQS